MSKQNRYTETKVDENPISPLKQFPTGSSYNGDFDALGMSGYGVYTFANGVMYRGQFEDGMFHGIGELVYNKGSEVESVIRGQWVKGVMKNRTLYVNGTLEYEEDDWQYCKLPDRRFWIEYETDLQPAGKPPQTLDFPPREIPFGWYDTGDGFYDRETKAIFKYEHKPDVIRAPSLQERKWILNNCRMEPLKTIGPRPDFYKQWLGPVVEPIPLPDRKKSRYQSIFNQADEDDMSDFYDPTAQVDIQRVPQRKFQTT